MTVKDARSETLRIALLIWSVLVPSLGPGYGLRRTVKITAPRLKDALVKARADYLSWNGHTDILVWILTVGTMSLGGGGTGLVHSTTRDFGRLRGINSEAEFLGILEGLLHVREVQHTPFKKIIDKLEANKQWLVNWQSLRLYQISEKVGDGNNKSPQMNLSAEHVLTRYPLNLLTMHYR